MELTNSTVLITGGTSGIGLEFVKQLSEQGANIIVTARNIRTLQETQKKFPHIHIFPCDVSKAADITKLYQEVTRQFPDLNMLINNAGLMRQIDLQDTSKDLENITQEVHTNLTGAIQMVHQFLPHLLTQKSAAIVNVSSAIAFMPYTVAPIYSASKAGLHAYTKALRLQLENTPVKVFEVIPPGVNTNLHHDWVMQPNPSMMMDVDKLVQVAINGLAKNKPEIKPAAVSVIKAVSRITPGLLLKFGHGEFKKFKALENQKLAV
jgi:uncharacterized oxidoreductase